MASSSSEELNILKKHYAISDDRFLKILTVIILQLTDGYVPVKTPKVIILGAQPGAGKSQLQKASEDMLGRNAVVCNADNLRDFHPLALEIKSKYPEHYPELTAVYAQRWNDLLASYCREKKLNYILETTFSSGERLNSTIAQLKQHDYQVDIMLLAVSPRLSLLGTYMRYEDNIRATGLGRAVSKEAHDSRYHAIPATIEAITKNPLYDNIYIYSRSIVLEYTDLVEGVTLVAHNPASVLKVYREEIDRPWSDRLKEYFKKSCNDVFTMMRNRSAHPREIERFRSELNIVMPSSPKRGRKM